MSEQQPPEVISGRDGRVVVQFRPTEKGFYDLNFTHNEHSIAGYYYYFCFHLVVDQHITAYGSGLSCGVSGKESTFYIVGKDGLFSLASGPGKADIVRKKESHGIVEVSYVPLAAGEYNLHVRHKGHEIYSSPFQVKVSGEGQKRTQLSVAATGAYVLCGGNVDLANMVGVIRSPSGGPAEPCMLMKTADGKLAIASFQPKRKGMYMVEVSQDGRPISGSPFNVNVSEAELCHASKVHVSGSTKSANANQWNDVSIDLSSAGLGALGISIEGSHRSDLEIKGKSSSEYVLSYKPHEPGIYLLNVKFGDEHITGCPFMVSVSGEPSGRVRQTVTKNINAARLVRAKDQCSLELKLTGLNPLDLEAILTSPSGESEPCEIRDKEDHLFEIRFTPPEDGVHTLSIKYKGIHLHGSPFQFSVGKLPVGGSHKVEFGGTGVDRAEVNSKNYFNVYTREAGQGLLSIALEGPSKAEINVEDNPDGFSIVSYQVAREGDYGIHVKYNDQHIPRSPTVVHVSPESKDAQLVTLHGLRDRGLEVDKPATFNVKLNGANGTLKAFVKTPSGTEEDIFSQEIDHDIYAVRFIPRENGVYYVYIRFNEAHIPGSPFPMLVGKLGADPAHVVAKGPGIEKGEVGKTCKLNVITTNAGAGVLAVNIDGPSKVAIVCSEVEEGYDFTYTPMAPGDYYITVKFCSVTIAGSPFKAVITGKGRQSDIVESSGLFVETVEKKPGASKAKRFHGDANKVVAQGNGLKKGFPGRAANFTLDCKEAGQALLTLGMLSPNGNPVQELSYKKSRAGVYTVTYNAPEKGEHALTVRWGMDDIPGSPFAIPVG
ncbi:hypothetical protein HELRODRAFT_116537 [Helobdella robusta]|uniref:Uncharacterized protein n=1 Tax=Helobdella robusta TaxID=6412 RepID=T1EGF7_HELRO|nr:hypothetical protein HELRODRAFT_116537 [Helobdella robusta]ESN90148.1 hypothetical protein HELRODRAFT_116537 [Helobdella robusta]